MHNSSQQLISDARLSQRTGNYDLAIAFLQKAQCEDVNKEFEVVIHKLLCFNYRKIGSLQRALYHINMAIHAIEKSEKSFENENEFAICLMNKGIVFEELGKNGKALDCYNRAIHVLEVLHGNNSENYGIIINALLTLANLQLKTMQKAKAADTLRVAINYFGEGKENDRRYISACNSLREIDADFREEDTQ